MKFCLHVEHEDRLLLCLTVAEPHIHQRNIQTGYSRLWSVFHLHPWNMKRRRFKRVTRIKKMYLQRRGGVQGDLPWGICVNEQE